MAISDRSRIPLVYITAALDPTLVSGVYNYCDQWCMYCPITTRCLAFRCAPPEDPTPRSDSPDDAGRRMAETLQTVRSLNAAEGRMLPDLEAVLNNDVEAQRRYATEDPLHKMAMHYSLAAHLYLRSRPGYPIDLRPRKEGPTPFEVFTWYHMLVGVKVHRALMGLEGVARDEDGFTLQDALLQARTALVAIERSQVAIRTIRQNDADPRLELIERQLRPLPDALITRFPDVRSIVRPGLDDGAEPVAAGGAV